MIYDSIEYAERYFGISSNLDKALQYLKKTDLDQLPLGRQDIDGDAVFINVMVAKTNPDKEREYEFHKKYYDIQLTIIGREDVLFGTHFQKITKPYQEDIGFGTCECEAIAHLNPGRFVICEPEEPHLPCTAPTGVSEPVRKAVIKVLVE